MGQVLEQVLEQEEDTQKNKYLTFVLGNEEYGIEVKHVTEIMSMQSISGIPDLPDYVKGIINLRGKIIPVIDVRLRFRKEEAEYNDRTCTVVIDVKDISVGLIVDRVAEVLDISEENVVPPPQLNKGYDHKYIKGIGKVGNTVKLILDCDKLLNDDEIDNLESIV